MAHLGDRVAAFVDGQLPPDEAERAQDHLAACEACREAVLAQRTLKRRMTGLGAAAPTPSTSLLSALSDPTRLAAAAPPSRLHLLFDHALLRASIAASGASAVLVGLAYVVGAPHAPVDTVLPPVDRFVAQFRGEADPVQQTVRSATDPGTEVSLAIAPGHAIAPASTDSAEAVSLLEQALGSAVSVRLLAHRYDLSVAPSDVPGRTEVVVASAGHRIASYILDDVEGRLQRVVRYAQSARDDAALRAILPVSRETGVQAAMLAIPASVDSVVEDASDAQASREAASGESAVDGTPMRASLADRIDAATIHELASVGWPCHDRLGTALERVSARWVDLAGDKAIALTYTDGVSTLTVYEQNGALDDSATAGFQHRNVAGTSVWVRPGTPSVATWDSQGIVFTVVTDGPVDRLREAFDHLPQQPRRDGALDRVRTGLARLTSWVTPGESPTR
ncbi:zf-HC2 domain-containing protein [Mumia sp. ZJ430]|uniref:zf-HC2 domain-containing protein n=1 Tax=Mumia sp. ZJ430 TaxID=2708083 RepID=UPI001AB02D48|nr:zf-HC2 domain-containing protein [Mumia sp. ZJ430]